MEVNDAVCVRGRHRICERNGDREDLADRHSAVADHIRRWHAIHCLHRQEVNAVALLDRVDRDDVGMTESCHGPRFPLEALQAVARVFAGQHLQRDVAVQFGVVSEKNRTHATATELGINSVMANRGTNHVRPGAKCRPWRRAIVSIQRSVRQRGRFRRSTWHGYNALLPAESSCRL